jgi:hypothetical protein
VTEASEALATLAFMALDHAVASTIPLGGDLIPFAVVERSGERSLHRFVSDRLEESHRQSRVFVRGAEGVERAAIAWEGFVTHEGVRQAALLVEAYESGAPTSLLFAQRYTTARRLRMKRMVLGNPALVDAERAPLY